jgi:hypothetical protein
MEQDSSQEGLDVSPISDTKRVTEFDGETEHVEIGFWTQGRLTQSGKITADSRLNRGFKWTALEHMDDTTNDLAALTQKRRMKRSCNQIG